jgi:nicotinamide mononucleotide transporter
MDALLAAARPILAVAFTAWGSPVTWLEIAAFVLSIAMVLANARVNVLGWPLAITSSALYALLFADSKLYGEAALQVFFIVIALWGWWQWLRARGANGAALVVHVLTQNQRLTCAALTLLAWPVLALLLRGLTDSDVPWLDALPTVASVTATFFLGRKVLENWALWFGVNVFSVGLFAHKGLWLTVLLYALFALMSLWGWRAWQRILKAQHG